MTGRAGLAVAGAALLAGCGGGQSAPLRVSAASSLKTPFQAYGRSAGAGRAAFSFGGSDALAAQIRQGARPDVFAAANTRLPAALFAAGLVERPAVFASNRLVVAVPARGGRVRSLESMQQPGVRIAIGSPGVPAGDYARAAIARLAPARARAILGNVRTREPDVAGIVAKLAVGAADAGFVYVTDVRAAGGRLRAIELPGGVRPHIAYAAAVVRGAGHGQAARAFIRGLLAGPGRRALRRAGFGPPPR